MFKFVIFFALMALTLGLRPRPLVNRRYPPKPANPNRAQGLKLCTYSGVSFAKCQHIVQVAKNDSVDLNLDCVYKRDSEHCIESVQAGLADMVVLSGHGYRDARNSGLKPFVFAKEDDSSLYIAVAPRNITLIGLQEAPIYFDQSEHRAFHAATFFNLRMGHDICAFLNKASLDSYIGIVDSKDYEPKPDEFLICPNRLPDEIENYKNCNVEAGLQRAVFIKTNLPSERERGIHQVFNTILQIYGNTHVKSDNFKFFATFQDEDDVIFKKNTISFDSEPTYRNGVDETVFNQLHCDSDDQTHDHRYLL